MKSLRTLLLKLDGIISKKCALDTLRPKGLDENKNVVCYELGSRFPLYINYIDFLKSKKVSHAAKQPIIRLLPKLPKRRNIYLVDPDE